MDFGPPVALGEDPDVRPLVHFKFDGKPSTAPDPILIDNLLEQASVDLAIPREVSKTILIPSILYAYDMHKTCYFGCSLNVGVLIPSQLSR